MAGLGTGNATLLDWAKTRDPNGKTAKIVELLAQTNGMLEDMSWREGNQATGHVTSVRTGLPNVYWRLVNQGVQPSKSTSAQITEGIGMLEAWSEVDVELANLEADVSAYRMSESTAFLEAMSQEFASTCIYGNSSISPEEFNGLAIRYSSLTAAGNSQNVIGGNNASGSDQTSIYLVGWGDQTVHGIFPKGSAAGLEQFDYGEQTAETTAGLPGARMRVYQERFVWKGGLCVKDWRYVVRICNIDTGNLVSGSNPAPITTLMIKALHRIPNLNACRPVFYMNRSVFEYLDLQRRADVISGGQLKYEVVDGKAMYTFRNIPVKIMDSILNTESVVS